MPRLRTKPKTRYYVVTCANNKIHHIGIVPSDRDALKYPLKARELQCSCGIKATYQPSEIFVTDKPPSS